VFGGTGAGLGFWGGVRLTPTRAHYPSQTLGRAVWELCALDPFEGHFAGRDFVVRWFRRCRFGRNGSTAGSGVACAGPTRAHYLGQDLVRAVVWEVPVWPEWVDGWFWGGVRLTPARARHPGQTALGIGLFGIGGLFVAGVF
jgi:hypothetical protein